MKIYESDRKRVCNGKGKGADGCPYLLRGSKRGNTQIGRASCRERAYSEAREAAQAWLDAIGTDKEAEMAENLIAELEEDLMPVEQLIAFAESEAGAGVFGDKAGEVAAHGRTIREAGGKYCDCPACAAVEAILEKKGELL